MEWRKRHILFFHLFMCHRHSLFSILKAEAAQGKKRNGLSVLNQTLIFRNVDYMEQVKQ